MQPSRCSTALDELGSLEWESQKCASKRKHDIRLLLEGINGWYTVPVTVSEDPRVSADTGERDSGVSKISSSRGNALDFGERALDTQPLALQWSS